MEYSKKDLTPIWVYFAVLIGLGFVFGMFLGFKGITDVSKYTNILNILSEVIIFFIFLIIYKKNVIKDFKRLNKKSLIFIIISFIIIYAGNYILSNLFEKMNIVSENQNTIVDMLSEYKLTGFLTTVVFAPFIEELMFRYSIRTFIKNDIVFLIVSSLLFGVLHGVNKFLIIYVLIGAALGYVFLKEKDNVASSMIVHMLNNLVSVSLILLLS